MFHALYEQPELICSHAHCHRRYIGWLLNRRIRLRTFVFRESLPADIMMLYLKEFGQYIQSLELSDCASSTLVEEIAHYCPSTTSLKMIQLDGTVLESLRFFQSVQQLTVRVVGNAKLELPSTPWQLPNLLKLTIRWRTTANKEIVEFVQRCPHLTHFSPHNFACLPEFVMQMVSHLSHLVALNLSAVLADNATLSEICTSCPCIVHLDISNCDQITDEGVYRVATTLKLKSIALPCDYKVTDKSLEYLSYCAGTLQVLHIVQRLGYNAHITTNITQSAVDDLLSKTSNCVYTWSTYVYDRVLNWRICANATHIIVDSQVTDALLYGIAAFCKHLVYLELDVASRTEGTMTNEGLYAVIHGCPFLQFIYCSVLINTVCYAEVMRTHSTLFTSSEVTAYDVMEMM